MFLILGPLGVYPYRKDYLSRVDYLQYEYIGNLSEKLMDLNLINLQKNI